MEDIDRKQEIPKKVHPKERANCLSSLCFCWPLPIFVKGLKKDLTEEDLYGPLKSHESRKLGNRLKKAWEQEQSKKSPSLGKTIVRVYYKYLLFYAAFLIIQEFVVKLAQPLCVGKLMEYYTPHQTHISKTDAYIYAAGIVFLAFSNAMLLHFSFFGLQHLSLRIQVACRALIYSKALKLTKNAVAESTVGQMVNLISNDVSRFQYICLHLHQMLLSPVQTLIVLYLLFSTVDTTAMAGVGLLLLFIPLLLFMGKFIARYRRRIAQRADFRIRLMNEIISGMQVIKMYTWEKPFSSLIQMARKKEIHEIKSGTFLRTLLNSTTMFLMPASVFLCVLTYVLTGNTLNAQFVYVVTSYYGTLRQPLTLHLPQCIATLAEIKVSLQRIQQFLLREEVQQHEEISADERGFSLKEVCVRWRSSDFSLSNINMRAVSGQLIGIIGRVGSGKTTLIQTILKEIALESGAIKVNGVLSYASQEPWLFSSSIKQNILFGQEMDAERYKKVVQVCDLARDFQNFPYGDRTIVGEKGIMLSGGQKARVNLARAIYKEADIYLLDDPLSAVDVKVGKKIFNDCIYDYLKNKCTVLVTHQIQYLGNVDMIYLLENGAITKGTYAELLNSRVGFSKFLQDEKEALEEEKAEEGDKTELDEQSSLPKENKERREIGNVSKQVYLQYFRIGGSYCAAFFVILSFILTQLGYSSIDYFLSIWVNFEQRKLENPATNEDTIMTSNNLLYLYSFLIIFLASIILIRSLSFVQFSMNTAKCLHNFMFDKVIHTNMRFFYVNSTGRILNRFARDMSVVDEAVPLSLVDTLQVFLNVAAITIIISSVNPWIILPTVVTLGIFYGYKVVFLSTSRDLKRMESTARSPMFSHLTQSLLGLSTIRAFQAQKILELEFDHILNNHSSAYYMFMACSRAFAFWLDMSCVVYIGIVVFSFLFIGTETYGGNVGLAITQAIALTGTLQRGIRQWSELENQMTSVERIVEYTKLPQEPDDGKLVPQKQWPSEGKITFENLSMKYFKNGPFVLKNLNLEIAPKEKIGIVGRTGAGKSSLIQALFRLAHTEGRIIIDGVNTSELSLNQLRSAISIIPQEPVLFSGTLRRNLDPFDNYSDEDLWNALEEVELKKLIAEMPSGLSCNVSESGSNFSVGERQLICLARAIVQKNNILVLDEATANIDLQTDDLIQKTIRRKFKECTVLTIAHRLQTIMNSDKILAIDEGQVVQFGPPGELLHNKEGLFYMLVQQTGKGMSERLMNMVK